MSEIKVSDKVHYGHRDTRSYRQADPVGIVTKVNAPDDRYGSYEVDWQDGRGPQWGYGDGMLIPEGEW